MPASAFVIGSARPLDLGPTNRARGREAIGALLSAIEGAIAGTNSTQADCFAFYPNCTTGEDTAMTRAFAVWETQGLISSGTIGVTINGVALNTASTGDPYGDAANIKKLVQISTTFGVKDFVGATNLAEALDFSSAPQVGDTVHMAGVTLTAVDATGGVKIRDDQFDISSGDKSIMAQAFATCVNRHPVLSQIYRAWSYGAGEVTVHPMDDTIIPSRDNWVCIGNIQVVLEMQEFLSVCVFAKAPGNHGNIFTIDCTPPSGAGISILNNQVRLIGGNGNATTFAQFSNF